MPIALLEDDAILSEQLASILAGAGYESRTYDSGEAFLSSLGRDDASLLLADWNLPGLSGLEVLKRLRLHPNSRALPVILLTSRSDVDDVVKALNAGADDYVVKPADPKELLARVAALLRRSAPGDRQDRLTIGPFEFDVPGERLFRDNLEIALTSKEFQLALLLLSNPNRALSREFLMSKIWSSRQDVPTRTLDVHISKVRRKLALRPETGYRLTPIYSYGYRLEPNDDMGGL